MAYFCMRGPRWPGSGGVLGTVIGAMLLTLGRSQSVSPLTSCTAGDGLNDIPQPDYSMYRDSFGVLAPLVQSFLHVVQGNPFPKDLILKLFNEFSVKDTETIKEFMWYEVGFLVCAALGVLYIILMPIIGIFLACCRCCGNCGGKMYQEQTACLPCCRGVLYWSTFAVTVVILAGDVCLFKSNEDLNGHVTQSPAQVNAAIGNIDTFIQSVPQQIQFVLNNSFTTIDTITSNLNDIGPQLGTEITKQFHGSVHPLQQSLRLLDKETQDFILQIGAVDSSLTSQWTNMNSLRDDITVVKTSITNTINDPSCLRCVPLRPTLQPRLDSLKLDGIGDKPDISALRTAVTTITDIDLPSKISDIDGYLRDIPQTVTHNTQTVVEKATGALESVKTEISGVSGSFSLSSLTNVQTQPFRDTISKYSSMIKYTEDIRYKVSIGVCCVVLLVVLCSVLGLILGPLGLAPKADPTMRSCTADGGGTFFMMGAGFSFLFSWLLMILVTVLFLLGGNIHTLVCRPWSSGQLFEVIDSSGLVPDIGATLGLKSNLSVTDVYRGCKKDQSVWETLKMHELINLDDVLNTTKYTKDMQSQFESMTIPMSFSLLNPAMSATLGSFSVDTGKMSSAVFTDLIDAMSSNNLLGVADELDTTATLVDAATGAKLRENAKQLRAIHTRIEATITEMRKLNDMAMALPTKAREVEGSARDVQKCVRVAQDFVDTNVAGIIKTESKKFLDCQLEHLDRYIHWAKVMITKHVGRCKPLAETVDSMVMVVLCSYLVEPLNAFWFSLGWCLFFFIPSIILSIKLAKYYRKMKLTDDASHELDLEPNRNLPSDEDAQYMEQYAQPWPPHQEYDNIS